MFADGFLKDIIPDVVKSVALVPIPRLSGSLGYSVIKYAALLLFLVNIRSWPLIWHCECAILSPGLCYLTCLQVRVFNPVFAVRLRWYLLQLRLLFKSTQAKRSIKAKWLGELSPVGVDPLDFVHVWKNWACECMQLLCVCFSLITTTAALDDCDYNMHLSNSCYAKVRPNVTDSLRIVTQKLQSLDCVRLEVALKCFPTLFRAGGWIALGGTFLHMRAVTLES